MRGNAQAGQEVSNLMRAYHGFSREGAASELKLSRKDFLATLFSALDSNQIRYCVLHSWEHLPDDLPSDLDLAVHPEDSHQLRLALAVLHDRGYTPVQLINYCVDAYCFEFLWFEGMASNSLAVDVIFGRPRGTLRVPPAKSLVSSRRRFGTFWVSAPESEFVYLLAKKAFKGMVSARQARRLSVLAGELGHPSASRLARGLFLGEIGECAVEACASGRLDKLAWQLKSQVWKANVIRNPLSLTHYLFANAARWIRRWLHPTGLLVAVMGPDGAGKSTLIKQVVPIVGPAFRRYRGFHWRPMLLWRRKGSGDTTQPHGRPPNQVWWSIGRLFAQLTDYWLGYLLVIRPLLVRSGLVLFDRYFDDVLVDPKRYRYGGPLWLVRLFRWLVPRPDLLFILDASEEVILSRKHEVAMEELQRQRVQYLRCTNRGFGLRILDASAPAPQIAAECAKAIVECLSLRFQRRYKRWAAPSEVDARA